MKLRFLPVIILAVFCCGLVEGQEASSEFSLKEYTIPSSNKKIWVYLPKGDHAEKLPCVMIAPAGSAGFHGMDLAKGDMAEHIPYVKAGFVAIAYEVSGALPEEKTDKNVVRAVNDFVDSQGGFKDCMAAWKYAASRHAVIDSSRVYVAGHSSAAVIALSIAQKSPRLKGCLAYAPVVDLRARIGADLIDSLDEEGVKLGAYLDENSPHVNIKKLKCPVFLFSSADDENVSSEAVRDYAKKLKQGNEAVQYKEVEKGGHYRSMIEEGIPAGIEWMKLQESKTK